MPSPILRKGHFLGAKLRTLRKRNALTLEDLSARCIQRDARLAPSVSYLSMIESGKRAPSQEVLELLAAVFQRQAQWFLDERADSSASVRPLRLRMERSLAPRKWPLRSSVGMTVTCNKDAETRPRGRRKSVRRPSLWPSL